MDLFNSDKDQSKIFGKVQKQLVKGDYFSVSFSYQMLSKLALEEGNLEKAISFLEHAISYSLKDRKFHTTAWLYKSLADLYFQQSDFEKTIENSILAADYFLKEKSIYGAQWAYNLAGRAAEKNNDFYSAIRCLRKSQEIEKDTEIQKEIENLKGKISHPLVFELVDKHQALEGERLEFKIVIQNSSSEALKKIKLFSKDDKILWETSELPPHSEKEFSFGLIAKLGNGKSNCKKVVWENIYGEIFEEQVDNAFVKIMPDVEIIASCNPPLSLGKKSDFVIIARNKSLSKISHIEFSAVFPEGLKLTKSTRKHFESLNPGEEKGVVYSIIPAIVGESKITGIKIDYKDEFGAKHETVFGSFSVKEEVGTGKIIERILSPPNIEKQSQNIMDTLSKKKALLNLSEYPISQEQYIKLTTTYASAETGYSLKDASVQHIFSHISDICNEMAMIGSHKVEKENLFFFSGVSSDTVYLLTVSLKQENSLITAYFKVYSNKKENLANFIETVSEAVKYTAMIMDSAKQVEKIEVRQEIKIIDSIIQRSQIGSANPEEKSVEIKDSIVQGS